MLLKTPSIIISGQDFYPSQVSKNYNLRFSKFHDVGDKVSIKSSRLFEYGQAKIEAPSDIVFNEQIDKYDPRITWLLNYLEKMIYLINNNDLEIKLDIDYTIDLKNLSQSYIDFLSIEQIQKMSELGVSFNVTIWPNN